MGYRLKNAIAQSLCRRWNKNSCASCHRHDDKRSCICFEMRFPIRLRLRKMKLIFISMDKIISKLSFIKKQYCIRQQKFPNHQRIENGRAISSSIHSISHLSSKLRFKSKLFIEKIHFYISLMQLQQRFVYPLARLQPIVTHGQNPP